jgi:hypothetical protein
MSSYPSPLPLPLLLRRAVAASALSHVSMHLAPCTYVTPVFVGWALSLRVSRVIQVLGLFVWFTRALSVHLLPLPLSLSLSLSLSRSCNPALYPRLPNIPQQPLHLPLPHSKYVFVCLRTRNLFQMIRIAISKTFNRVFFLPAHSQILLQTYLHYNLPVRTWEAEYRNQPQRPAPLQTPRTRPNRRHLLRLRKLLVCLPRSRSRLCACSHVCTHNLCHTLPPSFYLV